MSRKCETISLLCWPPLISAMCHKQPMIKHSLYYRARDGKKGVSYSTRLPRWFPLYRKVIWRMSRVLACFSNSLEGTRFRSPSQKYVRPTIRLTILGIETNTLSKQVVLSNHKLAVVQNVLQDVMSEMGINK